MKKVRITLAKGCNTKNFLFFKSVESLYSYLIEGEAKNDHDGTFNVTLSNDEFIEAEWCGCEFEQVGEKHVCFSYIRFAKMVPSKNDMIETYYAWTCNDFFKFENATRDGATFDVIQDELDTFIDMSYVFGDDGLDKDDVLGAVKK